MTARSSKVSVGHHLNLWKVVLKMGCRECGEGLQFEPVKSGVKNGLFKMGCTVFGQGLPLLML